MNNRLNIIIIALIGLLGCNEGETSIYEDQSFDDIHSIAELQNKPFCIVLTDDSISNLSKEYIFQLNERYKHLSDKAIFNISDISHAENEWCIKWLDPISIPLTCVFYPDGKLFDLIPGVSKETFLYIEEAIKKSKTTDFHWPNRFGMNKKDLVPLLSSLLQQKNYINEGEYSSSELDLLIDSLSYPYSHYIKLLGELMEQDTIESQLVAQSLIGLETPSYLDLYKNEFITAKKVLNPNFNIDDEPNIRVDSTSISLVNCKQNEVTPFEISVYNDGDKPLSISKIHLSCTCLEQHKYEEEIIINPKKVFPIKFYFTPDTEGEIYRDIFIMSNAINMPILHISIKANV